MDVLPRAIVKTKLKISGEKQVLPNIMARRQYGIAASIGKFKADNSALAIFPVLPSGVGRWLERSLRQYGFIIDFRRSQWFLGRNDDRLGQNFAWKGLARRLGSLRRLRS